MVDFLVTNSVAVLQGHRNGHEIVDTVGLSEGDGGTVHPAVAFSNLFSLPRIPRQVLTGYSW